MRGHNGEIGQRGRMDHQRLALKNGAENGLLFGDLQILMQENLAGIGLGVDIDEEDFLALPEFPW
jgi:hypothetical protein